MRVDGLPFAVLGRSVLNLDDSIARVPELAARLDSVPRVSDLRGAGPLLQRVSARSADRALLVGDASGYIDALTGEGLRLGFAEAEANAEAFANKKKARLLSSTEVARQQAVLKRQMEAYRLLHPEENLE